MINKLWIAMVIGCMLLAEIAQADDVDAAIASICDFTKANDRANLRKRLDVERMDLRRLHDHINCRPTFEFEGGSLLRSAIAHGASDTAIFIAAKIGKSGVMKTDPEGLTTLQWAERQAEDSDEARQRIEPVIELLKTKLQ